MKKLLALLLALLVCFSFAACGGGDKSNGDKDDPETEANGDTGENDNDKADADDDEEEADVAVDEEEADADDDEVEADVAVDAYDDDEEEEEEEEEEEDESSDADLEEALIGEWVCEMNMEESTGYDLVMKTYFVFEEDGVVSMVMKADDYNDLMDDVFELMSEDLGDEDMGDVSDLYMDEDSVEEGSYEIIDDVTVEIDGEEFTYDDGELVGTVEGMEIILVKN